MQYLVFEKRRMVVPQEGGQDRVYLETWVPVHNQTVEEGPDGEPRVFEADSQDEAIDLYAEEGDELREGTYRAVSLRNWGEPVTLRKKIVTDRQRG